MGNLIITIPSKSRAGNTTTQNIIKNGVWFVPQSEVKMYESTGLYKHVIGVPNNIRGITATRNFILDTFPNQHIVMVDDDVKSAGYLELMETKSKFRKIDDEQIWARIFRRSFDTLEGFGWKIWGLKTEGSLMSFYPYKPFVFKTYVTASCMGIINDGEFRFDERFKVKEDYDIGLQHIQKYGGVLGVRYVYWQNKHWDDDGGCKDYRTESIEREAILLLQKKYPTMIREARSKNNIWNIKLNF
jgi:hypothetical protein